MNDRQISRAIVAIAIAAAVAGCGRNDPDKFIASAEAYIAKSNYKAAAIELKNALSNNPDHARARFLLGKASLEGGDPVGATTEFRKAIALHYPADDVYPLLARALMQQGAPKGEMLELANAPVQSAHAKAEVAAMLGMAYLGLGQAKDARAQIDSALALEPSNASARVAQARLMAVENDIPGALQRVDALLATAPDDLDALMLKSELELAIGRRSDAIRTLENLLARYPEKFYARYLLVTNFVKAKELDKATAQLDELKKLAPADPRTFHAVALVALARGDVTEVVEVGMNAEIAQPTRVIGRRHFEEVLIQRTRSASPEHTFQGTRPRKEDVPVIDDIVRVQLSARSIRSTRVAGAELGDLDDRKRSIVRRRVLLERQSIQEACDLIEALHLPPLRNLPQL